MSEQLLHYQFQPATQNDDDNRPLMVFLHGLFGDLNNLGAIARAFNDRFDVLKIDLRNHGRSFHSGQISYPLMAEDVIRVISHLGRQKVILVGHSMGGKTAMMVAHLAPQLVEKLVVIDIAPVLYPLRRHDAIFAGLFAVREAKPANRQQAIATMATHIPDVGIQQFMLKSFDPQSPDFFRFNLSGLYQHYERVMDWQSVSVNLPTLFIRGGLSEYIQPEHTDTILAQFPQATSFTIASADHWVHAEKPEIVVRAIERFIQT